MWIRPDYFVGANGHVVEDAEGRIIHSVRMAADLYFDIIDYCDEHDLGFFWKYEDNCHAYHYHKNIPLAFKGMEDRCFMSRRKKEDLLPNAGALFCRREEMEAFKERFSDRVDVVNGGYLMYDVNIRGINKSQGIAALMELLGIRPEEVMAFGDSENDIEMFQYAGIGVCMGNGMEIARNKADYITKTSDESGIRLALQHFDII